MSLDYWLFGFCELLCRSYFR